MTTRKITYATAATVACDLTSLASSSTLVAGRSTASVDNTSTGYTGMWTSGHIMSIATPAPTAGKLEIWAIPKLTDGVWPDTFDGTDKNVTVTSRARLFSYGKIVASIDTDTGTAEAYEFSAHSLNIFGGNLPIIFQFFVVHSMVQALHATAGNHVLKIMGENDTFT